MTQTAETEITSAATTAAILDVTAELLGEHGCDGLQLRDVAKNAKVSLATVYKHFPSRDELMVAAVERWMAVNVYRRFPKPRPGEELADGLIRSFRHVFTPWKRNPTMLSVFLRVALLPGGERLSKQGADATAPTGGDFFAGYDAEFTADVKLILGTLTTGLLTAFATGRIDVAQIMRVYERAVYRLTSA